MKNKRKIIIALITLLGVNNAIAQSAEDIYRISFKNRATGTARSAAMGGAFTSLGADAASITLNPAGLGMYRSSEVSFTPSLFTSTVNSFSKSGMYGGLGALLTTEKITNFTVNNFSSIFNIFNGRDNKAIRSFTMGVSYSKDNYTNYKSQSVSDNSTGSMGDYFAAQLYGIPTDNIADSKNPGLSAYQNNSPGLWGGIMAYNTFLIDLKDAPAGTTPSYQIDPNALSPSDQVAPSQRISRKSMIDNFNVSFGINIEDILYVGATMGGRFYEYHNTSEYQEDDDLNNRGNFRQLNYIQYNNVTGSAFDFKVGATLEPLNGLKIGAAFHFPTISYINDEYYADMSYMHYEDEPSNQIVYYDAQTPYNPLEYKVKSAPSLLTGISYRLPFAILSFDFERTWYNKMKVMGLGGSDGLNSEIKETYKATNNYMAGLEVQPLRGLFLRGGYAYYGSALNGDYKDYGSTKNISAGIGYKSNSYYIDFTYTNSKYKTLPYKYYEGVFVNPETPSEDVTVMSDSTISQEFKNTILSLTVGFRF